MAFKPSKKSDTPALNIHSYIRVRPLGLKEKRSPNLELGNREITIKSSPDVGKSTKTLTFDRVFDEDSKQASVYSTIVRPMIREVIQGYNCTVFAYGQTGTGKTHTMTGYEGNPSASWEENSQAGIIPRALDEIYMELAGQTSEHQVSVSFMELYNEKLKSLLNESDDDDVNIQLIDDLEGGVILKGLSPTPVKTKDEALQLLKKGAEKKHVAATLMNLNSSRSHTIFTISVNIKESVMDKDDVLRVGKLHLVDLAGSENVSKSGATEKVNKSATGTNKRLTEASNINKSLLTLGRVITCITDNNPHIPYRESKLTRLLRDSLGGKTKTCIIGTISPSHANLDESESTLNYAYKARSIKNKPEKNQTISRKEFMQVASEEIQKLKRDLEAVRHGDGFFISKESHAEMTAHMQQLDLQVMEWYERYNVLDAKFKEQKEILSSVRDGYEDKCVEIEELDKIYQAEAESFKHILLQMKREVVVREYYITEYAKTEAKLTDQARTCKSVLENVVEQSNLLYDKIDKNKTNQNANIKTLDEFKELLYKKIAEYDQIIKNLYGSEEHVLERVGGFADNILQFLTEEHTSLKTHTTNYMILTENFVKELHQLEENMITILENEMDVHHNLTKNTVMNHLNDLRTAGAKIVETGFDYITKKATEIGERAHCVRQDLMQINKEKCAAADLQGHTTKLNDIMDTVMVYLGFLEMDIQGALAKSNQSRETSKQAIEKVAVLEANLQDLHSKIEQTKTMADDTHIKLNQVSSEAAKTQIIFRTKMQECIEHSDKLTTNVFASWEDMAQNHEIQIIVLKGQLDNLKAEAMEMKVAADSSLKLICDKIDTQCHGHELRNRVDLKKIKACAVDIKKNTQAWSSMTNDFWTEQIQHNEFCDYNLKGLFQENHNYIDNHGQLLEQHQEVTSEKLKNIEESISDMQYSLDIPQGTTPQRIAMSDLKYPKEFDSTAPRECLEEKFKQGELGCEDAPCTDEPHPVMSSSCSSRRKGAPATQLHSGGSDTLSHIRDIPCDIEESRPSLRRSTSMPNVQATKQFDEEEKENRCLQEISIKKKKKRTEKTALKRPVKVLRVLSEMNNSPNSFKSSSFNK